MSDVNMRSIISLEASAGQALEVASLDVSIESYMASLTKKAVKGIYYTGKKTGAFAGAALYAGGNKGLQLLSSKVEEQEALRNVAVPTSPREAANKYAASSYKEVYTPQKMAVPYLVYLNAIENHLYIIEGLQGLLLQPLRDLLTAFLSEPSEMSKVYRIGESKIIKGLPAALDALKACYSKDCTHKAKFSAVYNRMADFRESYLELNNIIDTIKGVDIGKVVDDTNNIVELADLVFKRCTEEPETYKLSKGALKALSELMYCTAQVAEYMGTIVALVDEASVAMTSNLDII